MKNRIFDRKDKVSARIHRRRKRIVSLVAAVSLLVGNMTALPFSATAEDKVLSCTKQEHVHTDKCYEHQKELI